MNTFMDEFQRYRRLMNDSLSKVSEDDFFRQIDSGSNSIAIILKHISGNLESRFTDFLTSDGEKVWRNRDEEFKIEQHSRIELLDKWERSWGILESVLDQLSHEDLTRSVKIRGVELSVSEALARSMAHFSYHVGQIAFLAKHFKGEHWQSLSITPGKSDEYNNNPTLEKGVQPRIPDEPISNSNPTRR